MSTATDSTEDSDAAMWKRRCQRYEQHIADHVPQALWPELFEPVGPTPEQASERAAEALALAYDLDGSCMQRVVARALRIWMERYQAKAQAEATGRTP